MGKVLTALCILALFVVIVRNLAGPYDKIKVLKQELKEVTTRLEDFHEELNAVKASTSQIRGLEAAVTTDSAATCLDPNGPTPVILMTKGRSGSSSTFQIMTALTGFAFDSITELAGKNWEGVRNFFQEKGANPKTAQGQWAIDYLCKMQQRAIKEGRTHGIVGFKWKPYAMDEPESLATLQRLSALSNTTSPIKLVRSTRNPLDVHLSGIKHKASNVNAHCRAGDTKCIQRHANVKREIPNVGNLYNFIKQNVEEDRTIDQMLKDNNVPVIFIEYDQLYYPETPKRGAKEWNMVAAFLGAAKTNWTWEEIQDSMGHAATTASRSHRDLISNFEQVQAALEGTDMAYILRH